MNTKTGRRAEVSRRTNETDIVAEIELRAAVELAKLER